MTDPDRIVPASEAPWRDVQAVLAGANCHGDRCFCQRFTVKWNEWRAIDDVERARRLREQVKGDPTCGLVAYVDDEAAGWVRVGPRSASGARALEGYPMDPDPGKTVQWGELHVGKRSASRRPDARR